MENLPLFPQILSAVNLTSIKKEPVDKELNESVPYEANSILGIPCDLPNFNDFSANNICNRGDFEFVNINTINEESIESETDRNVIQSKIKTFTCKLCNECFDKKKQLISHRAIHKTEKIFSNGNFTTNRKKQLKTHLMSVKHQQKSSSKVAGLLKHNLVTERKEIFSCNECDKKFNYKRNFDIHVRKVHRGIKDPKSFKCPECSNHYTTKRSVDTHVRIVHQGIKDLFCHICRNKYVGEVGLKKHLQKVHYINNFNLPCKSDFSVNIAYKKEKKFFDENVKVEPAFNEEKISNLVDRNEIQSDDTPFRCEMCCKTFSNERQINAHMVRVHQKEKSLAYIGFSENFEKDIKKNFKCKECDKKFSHQGYLNVHVRNLHLGANNFACRDCTEKFSCKSNLILHLKNVHHRKDYYKLNMNDFYIKTVPSGEEHELPTVKTEPGSLEKNLQ